MGQRKLITRLDAIILSIIVISALGGYAFAAMGRTSTNVQAEIRVNGRVVQTISLETDGIFTLPEHPAIQFIVSDGGIAFYTSDCPDQICVRNGFLRLAGQTSVCLPNRVMLTIVSTAAHEADIDFFLRACGQ